MKDKQDTQVFIIQNNYNKDNKETINHELSKKKSFLIVNINKVLQEYRLYS